MSLCLQRARPLKKPSTWPSGNSRRRPSRSTGRRWPSILRIFRLGTTSLELNAAGKTDEAEQVFRRLMQSNPEHVLAFTNLATVLSGQKRYAEAEAVARQAMKLHKFSFKANFVLGTVLIDQGKWSDEAKITLQYAQVKYAEAKTLLDRWP